MCKNDSVDILQRASGSVMHGRAQCMPGASYVSKSLTWYLGSFTFRFRAVLTRT